MADRILDSVRDAFDGQIDFKGQRLAEQITTNTLASIGLVSFLVGYIAQNIQYSLWIGLAGTALTFLAVVPPWPFLKRSPASWLPVRSGVEGIIIAMDGKTVT